MKPGWWITGKFVQLCKIYLGTRTSTIEDYPNVGTRFLEDYVGVCVQQSDFKVVYVGGCSFLQPRLTPD